MERILEEVLPARFGGSPLDYQLLEEEGATGVTRLSLIVSPTIELAADQDAAEAVLEELGRRGTATDLVRAIWTQAGTLRVLRQRPIVRARGKMMPLHRIRSDAAPAAHKGEAP
jgi:hypothetical protein